MDECFIHFFEAIVFLSEKLVFMRFKVLTQALTPLRRKEGRKGGRKGGRKEGRKEGVKSVKE